MSEMDLKLSYKLGRDDYWAAQVRILRQGSWRAVTLALGLWMVSALAGSFYVMQAGPKWTAVAIGFVALYVSLGITLFVAIVMRLIGRITLNRALNFSVTGPLAPTTLDVTDDGILWRDGTIETWYSWAAIERIEVTDRLILLYSSPVQAIMIPRRVLGSEEAMLSFVGSVREKVIAVQRPA